MTASMRQSTLSTMGLGSVLDIFKNGKLPVTAEALVDADFEEIVATEWPDPSTPEAEGDTEDSERAQDTLVEPEDAGASASGA